MPITALYGALLTLAIVALGYRVSAGRLARLPAETLRQEYS